MKPSSYLTDLSDLITVPKQTITLDFETFFDTADGYSLRKMSIEQYVRDPRFMVQGIGVKLNDGPTRWAAGPDHAKELIDIIPWHKALVIAHNARFDGFILSQIFNAYPAMWVDTMSLANMVLGNDARSTSLYQLSRRFLPEHMWKKPEALHNVDGILWPSEEQMRELGVYCKMDTDSCHALAQLWLPALDRRPLEIPLADMIIKMFTMPEMDLDTDLLWEIYQDELKAKEEAVEHCIAPNKKALNSNQQMATLLAGLGVDPPMKLNAKNEETFAMAKTDKEFTNLQFHEDKDVRDLIKARLRVKSSIEETRALSYHDVSARGTWPVALNVSGARATHRLTGSADGGGNPQNLSNVDKSRLRYAVKAPPDQHLLVIDSGAIDLRAAMTLAGETDVTTSWNDPKFDLYKAFAAHLFDIEVKVVDYAQRKLGKVSLLSLQYGSGAETFQQMAWNRGVELTLDEAAVIVYKYRQAFPHIVATWKALNYVLRKLVRGEMEDTHFDHLAKANPRTISGVPGIDVAGGMPITYPKLSYEMDPVRGKPCLMYTKWDPKTHQPMRAYLYGAKAFGHICQNAARNIVMPQTLAVDVFLREEVHPDCRSVMSVHDEGGYLIPDEAFKNTTPDDVYAAAKEIMCTAPAWWPEIKLIASGGITKGSYGDVK